MPFIIDVEGTLHNDSSGFRTVLFDWDKLVQYKKCGIVAFRNILEASTE